MTNNIETKEKPWFRRGYRIPIVGIIGGAVVLLFVGCMGGTGGSNASPAPAPTITKTVPGPVQTKEVADKACQEAFIEQQDVSNKIRTQFVATTTAVSDLVSGNITETEFETDVTRIRDKIDALNAQEAAIDSDSCLASAS